MTEHQLAEEEEVQELLGQLPEEELDQELLGRLRAADEFGFDPAKYAGDSVASSEALGDDDEHEARNWHTEEKNLREVLEGVEERVDEAAELRWREIIISDMYTKGDDKIKERVSDTFAWERAMVTNNLVWLSAAEDQKSRTQIEVQGMLYKISTLV